GRRHPQRELPAPEGGPGTPPDDGRGQRDRPGHVPDAVGDPAGDRDRLLSPGGPARPLVPARPGQTARPRPAASGRMPPGARTPGRSPPSRAAPDIDGAVPAHRRPAGKRARGRGPALLPRAEPGGGGNGAGGDGTDRPPALDGRPREAAGEP